MHAVQFSIHVSVFRMGGDWREMLKCLNSFALNFNAQGRVHDIDKPLHLGGNLQYNTTLSKLSTLLNSGLVIVYIVFFLDHHLSQASDRALKKTHPNVVELVTMVTKNVVNPWVQVVRC